MGDINSQVFVKCQDSTEEMLLRQVLRKSGISFSIYESTNMEYFSEVQFEVPASLAFSLGSQYSLELQSWGKGEKN
jgi:NADH:ubiquinone oxidoreductase subunit D